MKAEHGIIDPLFFPVQREDFNDRNCLIGLKEEFKLDDHFHASGKEFRIVAVRKVTLAFARDFSWHLGFFSPWAFMDQWLCSYGPCGPKKIVWLFFYKPIKSRKQKVIVHTPDGDIETEIDAEEVI